MTLTLQEEFTLFEEAKKDRKKFEEFIKRYLPIAKVYASRYSKFGDYDDLYQEASIGIVVAFHHFDTSKGIRFKHYCKFWIRNKFQNFFWRNTLVRITREQYLDGLKPKKEESEGFDLENLGFDQSCVDFVYSGQLSEAVEVALSKLIEQEQVVLRMYFGIGCEEPLSYQKIGEILGYTKQRIHQLVKSALDNIKKHLVGVHDG